MKCKTIFNSKTVKLLAQHFSRAIYRAINCYHDNSPLSFDLDMYKKNYFYSTHELIGFRLQASMVFEIEVLIIHENGNFVRE